MRQRSLPETLQRDRDLAAAPLVDVRVRTVRSGMRALSLDALQVERIRQLERRFREPYADAAQTAAEICRVVNEPEGPLEGDRLSRSRR